MNNKIRRIIYIPTNDGITGELCDFKKSPYEGAINAFNKDYTVKYDGNNLSISDNTVTLLKPFGPNTLVSIEITNSDNLTVNIAPFTTPTLKKNPWSFLWYTDCWTRDRITTSRKKFDAMIKKGEENSIVLGSESIDLLYYKNDHGGFYRKKALLKNADLKTDTVKLLASKIIRLKMFDTEHIGWNCDYMSSSDNAKYDLLYEAPYLAGFDNDTKARKNLYLQFLKEDRCNYEYNGSKRLENIEYREYESVKDYGIHKSSQSIEMEE